MGDSLSAGYGLQPDEGWVYLLQQRLEKLNSAPQNSGQQTAAQQKNWRVVNASITGDTTRGGLARLPAALEREKPAVVILELGGNDGLRGFRLKQVKSNLVKMIDMSREKNAKVLLLGVQLPANYGKVFREKFQQIYLDIAEQENVAVVPFFLEGVAETRAMMQADGIHPAAIAQPRILKNVWPELVKLINKSDLNTD